MFSELIDNSLDANADKVKFEIKDDNSLVIYDNGDGINKFDPNEFRSLYMNKVYREEMFEVSE